MLINELSNRTGLSAHTLRYYENLGLIAGQTNPEVKSNNYKHYDEETVKKVKIIKDIQGIGFTLAEIKKMLSDCFSGNISVEEQIKVFRNKIKEVDDKIKHFKQIKSRLLSIVEGMENNTKCRL